MVFHLGKKFATIAPGFAALSKAIEPADKTWPSLLFVRHDDVVGLGR